MMAIHFPQHDFKIKKEKGSEYIFDEVRSKWVRLLPEEWVRQNFLQYLVQEKNYPRSLIAVEKEIQLHELKKRCDIVVYKNAVPWMVIECKEPAVQLNDAVLQQALRYNIPLQLSYIVITNGNATYGWEIQDGAAVLMKEIPAW